MNDLIFNALKLLGDDRYEESKTIIETIIDNKSYLEKMKPHHWQYIADIYLSMGKIEDAESAYNKANNKVGVAFTLILKKTLNDANTVLSQTNMSPAKIWCLFLVDLFLHKRKTGKTPSFLIIRHFLEFTTYSLLLTKNNDYLDVLLNNLKKLLEVNIDSEKMIGTAFYNFGEISKAKELFKNSIKHNQFDGENYFLLGRLYYAENDLYSSLSMLENARLFLPNHLPTEELYEKVKTLISLSQDIN